MRENSAKYYVAESMWMIINEFMTKKGANIVSVSTPLLSPCYHVY